MDLAAAPRAPSAGFLGDDREQSDIPNDFKKSQLETITALSPYAQIREHEETGVLASVLRILEMVETRDD